MASGFLQFMSANTEFMTQLSTCSKMMLRIQIMYLRTDWDWVKIDLGISLKNQFFEQEADSEQREELMMMIAWYSWIQETRRKKCCSLMNRLGRELRSFCWNTQPLVHCRQLQRTFRHFELWFRCKQDQMGKRFSENYFKQMDGMAKLKSLLMRIMSTSMLWQLLIMEFHTMVKWLGNLSLVIFHV